MFLSILAEMDFCSSLRVFSWGEKNQTEGWNGFFLVIDTELFEGRLGCFGVKCNMLQYIYY